MIEFCINLVLDLRSGAVWLARRAHNPKAGGSNPSSAISKSILR